MNFNHANFAAALEQKRSGFANAWYFALDNLRSPESPLEIEWSAVERHIWSAREDPGEMKHRIMAAWDDGNLSAEEVEEWIVLRGLEEA